MMLNWADYTIISIVSLSILISCKRGFLREVLSLATWLISFVLSILFATTLAMLLIPYIDTYSIRYGLSFLGIFIVSFVIMAISTHLIIHAVYKSGLSNNNYVLSLIFGLARGIVVTLILLLLISLTTFTQKAWWQQSIIIPKSEPIIVWLKTLWSDKIQATQMIKNSSRQ